MDFNEQVIIVTAGKECPKCGEFGLFKLEDGFRCESCLTEFDNELKEVENGL